MTFYTGPGCGDSGVATYWSRGSYDVNTPFFADNDVSSVDLPWGVTVVLYDGPTFNGQKVVLRRLPSNNPKACLDAQGFDDKASSFRVSDGTCTHALKTCWHRDLGC